MKYLFLIPIAFLFSCKSFFGGKTETKILTFQTLIIEERTASNTLIRTDTLNTETTIMLHSDNITIANRLDRKIIPYHRIDRSLEDITYYHNQGQSLDAIAIMNNESNAVLMTNYDCIFGDKTIYYRTLYKYEK